MIYGMRCGFELLIKHKAKLSALSHETHAPSVINDLMHCQPTLYDTECLV